MAVYKNTGIFTTRFVEAIGDLSHLEIGSIGDVRSSITEYVKRAVAVMRPDIPYSALEEMRFDEIQDLARSTLAQFARPESGDALNGLRTNPAFEDAWNLLVGTEVADHLWRFRNEALQWIEAKDLEAEQVFLLGVRWNQKPKHDSKGPKKRKGGSRISRSETKAKQIEKALTTLRQNNLELFRAADRYEFQQRSVRAIERHGRGDIFIRFPIRPKTAICPCCRAAAFADAEHCEQKRTGIIANVFERGMKLQVRRFEPDVTEIQGIRHKRGLASVNSLKTRTVDNPNWKLVQREIDAVSLLPGRAEQSAFKVAAEVADNLEEKGHSNLANIDTIRKKIAKIRRLSSPRQTPHVS